MLLFAPDQKGDPQTEKMQDSVGLQMLIAYHLIYGFGTPVLGISVLQQKWAFWSRHSDPA